MIAIGSCGHNCDDERIYYKQIKTLIANGYKIKYFAYCNESYLDDGYNDNIEYRFFNSTEISQKQYKTILLNLLKNTPPKVFHVHDMELLPVAFKLKKKYPEIKIIYDVHEDLDAMWDTFSSYSGIVKMVINTMLKKYERRYLGCVNQFILANQFARINKYSHYADVKIIENFPLLTETQDSNNNTNPSKLIYHGQLGKDRGIITLIDAFYRLEKKYDNLELTLIGTPRTSQFKKILIKKINGHKKIKLINQIPHSDIWEYLNDACIGVIPFHNETIFQYNTPTKLFEYMISDCAIVASDLKPIKEFCSQSASWALPGDVSSLVQAIDYYLNNTNEYMEHKKINTNLINTSYNWNFGSEKLLSIYKELLN